MAPKKSPQPARAKSRTPKQPEIEDPEPGAELTYKQIAFVEHYCQCWNATEAARRAKYSAKTANQQGPRLLVNAGIQQAIAARIAELKMTTDEVLLRLADHARGSVESLLDSKDEIDLKTARKNGKLHLVKKLKRTKRTDKDGFTTETTEVELHDPQAALVQIGRANKIFVDKVALTDPTGEKEYASLTDEERAARIAALLDRARARGAGSADSDGEPNSSA